MIHYTYIVYIIINHLSAVASESHLGKAVRLLCRDLEEIFEFVVLVYFCSGFEVVEQRHGGFLFCLLFLCRNLDQFLLESVTMILKLILTLETLNHMPMVTSQ